MGSNSRRGGEVSDIMAPMPGYREQRQLAGLEEAERLVRDYAEKYALDLYNERILCFAEEIE